jgi:hypothetical protein
VSSTQSDTDELERVSRALCTHFGINPDELGPLTTARGYVSGWGKQWESFKPAAAVAIAALRAGAKWDGAEDRLDWLERNPQVEVAMALACDDGWIAHKVHGGVNDREWTEIGRGGTLREAIDAARAHYAQLPPPSKEPAA